MDGIFHVLLADIASPGLLDSGAFPVVAIAAIAAAVGACIAIFKRKK